ncbi:MAG: hypothetical protein AAGB23_05280 [Pseudomonadota bacterium]
MGTRGRQSAASLSVISANGIEAVERPRPLAELTGEQSQVWLDVVNRLPAEWFPKETHGLLAQYCRHIVSARRVAQLLEQAEGDDGLEIEDYDRLLKMQEREGRAISSLATRMRLSQQATYDAKKSKPKAGKKPWQS